MSGIFGRQFLAGHILFKYYWIGQIIKKNTTSVFISLHSMHFASELLVLWAIPFFLRNCAKYEGQVSDSDMYTYLTLWNEAIAWHEIVQNFSAIQLYLQPGRGE